MTASFPNRNIVIASVQTGGEITPSHQTGVDLPHQRDNGGDLQVGDTFYQTDTEIIYFYDGNAWPPIGGPGLLNPLYNRIDELEQKVGVLEALAVKDLERNK